MTTTKERTEEFRRRAREIALDHFAAWLSKGGRYVVPDGDQRGDLVWEPLSREEALALHNTLEGWASEEYLDPTYHDGLGYRLYRGAISDDISPIVQEVFEVEDWGKALANSDDPWCDLTVEEAASLLDARKPFVIPPLPDATEV